MKLKQTLAITIAIVAVGLVGLRATNAHALTIALEPSVSSVTVADSFDVALTISGLTAGAAPSLGVYDINVLFDSSIFAFSGVAFGDPGLGDQLAFGFSLTDYALIAGGVNIFEVSLDSVATLNTSQAGAFTLATLSFDAIAAGTSAFTLNNVILGDAYGDPLYVDEVLDSSASASVIPEPSSAILFVIGALVMQRRVVGHAR
ncbi:MAG: hypothetical protein JRG94_17780 [Deltaproteobacteria bacterium]|nr:hypothetical protein [Deltaproteobacteria bacterium]